MHWVLPLLAIEFALGVALPALGILRLSLVWITMPTLICAGALVLRARSAGGLLLGLTVCAVMLGILAWRPADLSVDSRCDVATYARGVRPQRVALAVATASVPTPHGSSQQARALWLRQRDAVVPLCGTVVIYRPAQAKSLSIGQRVLVRGRLKPVFGRREEAQVVHLPLRVSARLFAADAAIVRLGTPRAGLLQRLRERVRRLVARACGVATPSSAIVRALVLGDRSAVTRAQREKYARAGLSHLLAVSGLHLSLVAGAAFALLGALVRRWTWWTSRWPADQLAAYGAILCAVGYVVLTGGSPATVRACVMASAAFVAQIIGRPRDFVRPLALAALVLLVHDPSNLFRAGFQLSFAAVVGIALAAAHPLGRRVCERGGVAGAVASLLVASLGATLLTAPLVVYHFGTVSLVGVASNLAAVPWTAYVLLPTALIGALLGLCGPDLGLMVLRAAGWFAQVLELFASWVGGLEYSAVAVTMGLAGAVGALAVSVALLARRRAWRAVLVLGTGLLVVDLCAGLACGSDDSAELTFIDVGQGDSTLVRFPDRATMLIDAGGSAWSGFDPGQSYVVPQLRAAGVRRLDYLVVSHPDADHAAGVKAVLDAVRVGEIWLCWHEGYNVWVERIRSWARAKEVPLRTPRALRHGGATVTPIWPPADGGSCANPALGTNNNSIVLALQLGVGSALLAGDIEAEVEQRLVSAAGRQAVSLLKVPHHGSSTSSTRPWLAAVRPRLAVVSCGRLNRFGFPHPAVVSRYRQLGIPLARTDQLGTIRVRLGPDGALRTWPGVALAPPSE